MNPTQQIHLLFLLFGIGFMADVVLIPFIKGLIEGRRKALSQIEEIENK